MTFNPGDVVRYADASDLCTEFMEAYGSGPYVVEGLADEGPKLYLRTMGGKPMSSPWGGRWRHAPENLIPDVFLDAVRKANTPKENHAKDACRAKTRQKTSSKSAAR